MGTWTKSISFVSGCGISILVIKFSTLSNNNTNFIIIYSAVGLAFGKKFTEEEILAVINNGVLYW